MHGKAVQGCTGSAGEGPQAGLPKGAGRHRRQMQRWCLAGVVGIPLLLTFLWLQFAAARSGGDWLYADQVCGCRDVLASWVSDYVWTQMIWLPGNTLFLLIWGALAVKLWSDKRRRR
ncbi:hypothetical protein [Herbaspirillum seropedicae]|uniref:Transmembrane protein n=1 Tax=Herbaspirillum seropedicae (strain SmR1) TaxID=757424 RepID=D8IWF7_HERSS|nr:hypothetical protein [Herbaspirillum seropedicae]ADJ63977.1 hypothetical protein Hsero_2478 [Herbaspirillum seropedicae SmR1]AON54809.1 hypothetical protein Hsc_2524 [Herbaspirillum seropedicae]